MAKKWRKKSKKTRPLSSECSPVKSGNISNGSSGGRNSSDGVSSSETEENSPVVACDSTTSTGSSRYPYPTDYNDHFETPSRAYFDVLPLLDCVISALQKRKKQGNKSPQKSRSSQNDELVLYDPYFCTGRAATLMEEVFHANQSKGRPKIRIQHEKRDFYLDVNRNTIPQHDIFITNPPYSGDHKERCLKFCVEQLQNRGTPFFLLMPNYIATKDYFRKNVLEAGNNGKKVQVVYVTPSAKHPYEYEHPEGTGHETSPFASVWFCGLSYDADGKVIQCVRDAFNQFHSTHSSKSPPRLATSLQELIRIGGVSGEKRKNPRQRKKMRQQAMQRANNSLNSGVSNIANQEMQNNNATNHGSPSQNFCGKGKKNKKGVSDKNSDRPKKKRRY